MPASTVRSSGWTGLSCRWLLRSACSLSSAGNVCWAKPNHGFFHCQHLRRIFFHAARAGDVARQRDRSTQPRPGARAPRRCISFKRLKQVFFCARMRMPMQPEPSSGTSATATGQASTPFPDAWNFFPEAPPFRVAQADLRKLAQPFGHPCAGLARIGTVDRMQVDARHRASPGDNPHPLRRSRHRPGRSSKTKTPARSGRLQQHQ